MAKRKKAPKIEAVKAWTWEIGEPIEGGYGLCYWSLPDRKSLMREAKPSPEARPVRVRIIRESDYRRLLRQSRSTCR